MEAPNLFIFFFETFSVEEIYHLGWYAAREWMALISGVLIALAIGIRMVEERVNYFTQGKTDHVKMATNVLLIAIAIGTYFVIASLVIDLFNAIYGMLDSGTMKYMAEKIDKMTELVFAKEVDIGWSIAYESIYLIASLLSYGLTYAILVFVVFAMRIAHAVLVSFVIFWGAVALPMSITTSLKQLKALGTMAMLALFWPIIDAFLMYLVGGAFLKGLENDAFTLDGEGSLTVAMIIFYLVVFSIINIFLVATTVSAPFIAQGVANGSGNVTGLIGSFAGAGISAGVLAGNKVMNGFNKGGSMGAGGFKDRLWGRSATDGGSRLRAGLEHGANKLFGANLFGKPNPSGPGPGGGGIKPSPGSLMSEMGTSQPLNAGGGSHPIGNQSSASGSNTVSEKSSSSSSKENISGTTATSNQKGSNDAGTGPSVKKSSLANSSNLSDEQQLQDQGSRSDNTDSGGDMATQEQKAKAKKQARRAAIIQLQKKPGKR